MHHANDIVRRIAPERDSGMWTFERNLDDLAGWQRGIDHENVAPVMHDHLDIDIREVENTVQHRAFVPRH